jgi:hypothetical protein
MHSFYGSRTLFSGENCVQNTAIQWFLRGNEMGVKEIWEHWIGINTLA